MNDTRYQFQPWYMKAVRQIRHMPPAYIWFASQIVIWLLRGAPPLVKTHELESGKIATFTRTRRQTANGFWMEARAWSQYKMNALMTFEEFSEELLRDD